MRTRAEWKQAAKDQLGNNIFGSNWMMALAAMVVFGAVISAAAVVIAGVGGLIVVGPLTVGLSLVFLKQARDNQMMSIGDLFKPFTTDFGGAFLLSLLKSIFIALWSLLFVIPGIVKSYAYSMAEFIKADHPEYGWKQCLDESCRITHGHKWELFVLDLSFIGWYFVGGLCLGIGDLWVAPYHFATQAQAYLDFSGETKTTEVPFVEFN